MLNLKKIPSELSFLSWIDSDRTIDYRTSKWLISPFEDFIWKFKFDNKRSFEIDFRVQLEDNSLLTDASNNALLDLLKCWICIQTHYDISGGIEYSSDTAIVVIRRVLNLIDYFLINAPYFELAKYGLNQVTENDLTYLLAQIASSSETSTGIYKWEERLTNYIRGELESVELSELQDVIHRNPFLSQNIPDVEERALTLSTEELVYARALFWRDGYYKYNYNSSFKNEIYKYSINTVSLSRLIYKNTLVGKGSKPLPPEFLIAPIDSYNREFSHVPVRNSNENSMTESIWCSYKRSLRTIGQLVEIGHQIPVEALKATENAVNQQSLNLISIGRFKTLPNEIVLKALSKSIEFALEYGHDLLESALAVISTANKKQTSCVTLGYSTDITKLLTPKVKNMGVKVWHLSTQMTFTEGYIETDTNSRPSSNEFFKRMRKNEGLYELVRVLFGAVEIVVGTVMARRQAELMDLISGLALDKKKENLNFHNGKSGYADMRMSLARPIPPLAANLVEMIQNFHTKLSQIMGITDSIKLFSYPQLHTGNVIDLASMEYNGSIDMLCDYIEIDLNENGQRYYIRQHQLRRFFAMMFFWGNAFGGMDALRWFLGHTDVQHLYHYITESTPGYILRASKAHYCGEIIKNNSKDSSELAKVISKHFHTKDFSILDSDELDEYIEELMIEGRLEVEPVFFESPEGKSYRIAIKVNEISARTANE